MSKTRDGLAQSVQVRLVRHAKAIGVDPNLVLTRYAAERFLYRLSRSPHADRFVLKGALLLLAWRGETLRPTRGADLLGFGDVSEATLARIFGEVCGIEFDPDAMIYLADTIDVAPIRPENDDGGYRVTVQSRLGPARLRVQVDVGIGDVVTPEPAWLDEYPALLDLPGPRLRAYSRASVIAEKLHAIVILGAANSRMKDYFDLRALLREGVPSPAEVGRAISATFERCGTPPPHGGPFSTRTASKRRFSKRSSQRSAT